MKDYSKQQCLIPLIEKMESGCLQGEIILCITYSCAHLYGFSVFSRRNYLLQNCIHIVYLQHIRSYLSNRKQRLMSVKVTAHDPCSFGDYVLTLLNQFQILKSLTHKLCEGSLLNLNCKLSLR